MDITARRISEWLNELPSGNKFLLTYKWGMDGSSDHSEFKNKSEADFSDSHTF